MNRGPRVSKKIDSAFIRFVEYHPAGRLSRNLRKFLMEYLLTDGSAQGLYFPDLLYDLEGLFELLDEIESDGGSC